MSGVEVVQVAPVEGWICWLPSYNGPQSLMSAGWPQMFGFGSVPGGVPVGALVLIDSMNAQLSAATQRRSSVATVLASECFCAVMPVSQAWKQ